MHLFMHSIYPVGVAVVLVTVLMHARIMRDDSAAQNYLWSALAAGLVWPLILAGIVQYSLFVSLRWILRRSYAPAQPHTVAATDPRWDDDRTLIAA